jgi:hypothetical protein
MRRCHELGQVGVGGVSHLKRSLSTSQKEDKNAKLTISRYPSQTLPAINATCNTWFSLTIAGKNTKMSRIISPLQGCGASAKSVILIHQERPSLGRHTTKAEVCAGVG